MGKINRVIFLGFLLAMAGLGLTVAGYRNDDPRSWLEGFKVFGPIALGGGLLVCLLGLFFFSD